MDYDELVRQYDTAKKEIARLQQQAKKLQGQILDTKEAREIILPLTNEGGQRTESGVTFEIKRKYHWDQDHLHTLWYQQPDENLPSFLTRQTVYTVNMKQYKEWMIANPSEASRVGAALSTELADPSIKSINLKEEVA